MTRNKAKEIRTQKHIGQRIRTLRKSRGENQEELGNVLGVTYQQIQKFEAATNRISAARLALIADHYGVDPEYFYAGAEESARAIVRERQKLQKVMEKAGLKKLKAINVLLRT